MHETLSYIHGASDVPLIGLTIGAQLERIVAAHGQGEALVSRHQGLRYTYAALNDAVDQVARALLSLGLEVGDRVGIWAPNCAEWVLVQFATAKIGAILVNVNPAYRSHELAYALEQSGVKLLITAPRFRQHDYRETLLGLVPELETFRGGMDLRAERLPDLRGLVVLGGEGGPGMMRWDDLLARAPMISADFLRERSDALQFDDPINIQYTSGTTGFPKGATLSHHNILNNGFFIGEMLQLTERDRVCIPVPLYHCFGMVVGNLACMTHGATIVLPGESFDSLDVLTTVADERCTTLHGVPTMFIAELGHPRFAAFDLSSLRTGIMAGSPCPVEVMRRVRTAMHMPDVMIAYGMTELSPVSFQTRPHDDEEKRISTVGTIHPHVETKIVDPMTGRVVPRGVSGEVVSRGYSVMLGYWNNPEATAAAIDAGRWMHTGDIGIMRADGYVNIVGRIKDMIIRGGENLSPREIEEFLYTHPKVADVQVIGVPDRAYGEEVCAWVKLRDGESATEEEIRAYCRGKIATYKIPRYVMFVDSFPMTVTGKVQKFKMREQAIATLGLQDAAAIETA